MDAVEYGLALQHARLVPLTTECVGNEPEGQLPGIFVGRSQRHLDVERSGRFGQLRHNLP